MEIQNASELNKVFMAYLNEPTRENYLELWKAVVRSPAYVPYSDGLKVLARLFEEGRHDDVIEHGDHILANFILSPSLHYYLGRSSAEVGDHDREKLEKFIFRKCREGVLATGDGTVNQPYFAAHVDDEYEVLGFLKRVPVKQSLVKHENGRVFDVFSEESERETWFDITDLQRRAMDLAGGPEPSPGAEAGN